MAGSFEYQTVAQTLCRALPMPQATYIGSWVPIQSARDLDFFIRFTSSGAPNLAVSVDLSPFPVFIARQERRPSVECGAARAPVRPQPQLRHRHRQRDRDDQVGWSLGQRRLDELGPVTGIASHYSALRYRIVVTTADATSVDFVMTRAAR